MTQATDTDLRELKTAIDGNTRSIADLTKTTEGIDRRLETLTLTTEANTKAIESIDRRLEALTSTTEALTKNTEANAKAITDLTLEMRLGFGSVNAKFIEMSGQITNLDTKLSGEITNSKSTLSGEIDTLTGKFDERTKGLGQRLDGKELAQRNIFTGLTVTIVGGILLTLGRFLFFGTLP